MDVARKVGQRFQGLEGGAVLKSVQPSLAVVAGVLGLFVVVWRRKQLFLSREERLLRAFYRRVERDCLMRMERGRVGLFELAALTGNAKVRAFADIYAGAVYRDRKLGDDEYRLLRQIVKAGFR
jgi:hypothetical protein